MSFLQILTPCHEKWENMLPADRGRFCTSCNKTVRDLSGLSYEEIMSEWKNGNGEMCGKINGVQLHEGYVRYKLSKDQMRLARNFCFAILLSFGAALFIAKDASAKNALNSFVRKVRTFLPDSTANQRMIKGIVKDKDTGEALPFVNVMLFSGDSAIAATMSDIEGFYTIKVPKGKWKELSIKTSYIGYQMEVRQVKLKEEDEIVDLPIKITGAVLGGFTEIIVVEDETIDRHKLEGTKKTFNRGQIKRMPR